MSNIRAGILGTGRSYPEGVLTNADLEKIVETSDDWITTRTGIKQRRKAGPGEYTSQFATLASQQAIERAGIDADDIDLILCATVTPDQILPSTACLIQAQLGANKAAAMDIVAACSGFVYGITIAEPMIRSRQIKYALIIGAELLTRYVDYTDRFDLRAVWRWRGCGNIGSRGRRSRSARRQDSFGWTIRRTVIRAGRRN
jgi:3-oxoacyl-[acyl-carrier-protein] synthase-3